MQPNAEPFAIFGVAKLSTTDSETISSREPGGASTDLAPEQPIVDKDCSESGAPTFRRSLATLIISNGENVKVAQSQLRHTTPKIVLEMYAQVVSGDQKNAHHKVVRMVVPKKFSAKLRAREAASSKKFKAREAAGSK
jgi:hypothetical protein